MINVKNKRKLVVLFLALILIISSVIQATAVPEEKRSEYKSIAEALEIMDVNALEEYFTLYDKYHEDERFVKYFEASELSIPVTVEFFVSEFKRQPTTSEKKWIIEQTYEANYLNYGGLLGRQVTSAEMTLVDNDEGYKIFGIGTKEELKYLALRNSKEFNELAMMYKILYTNYDAFEWNDTTGRTTIRKKLLQLHGIDIFDMDYSFRKAIYDRMLDKQGSFSPGVAYSSIESQLAIGDYAWKKEATEPEKIIEKISYQQFENKFFKRIEYFYLNGTKAKKDVVIPVSWQEFSNNMNKEVKEPEFDKDWVDKSKQVIEDTTYRLVNGKAYKVVRYYDGNGRVVKPTVMTEISKEEAIKRGLTSPSSNVNKSTLGEYAIDKNGERVNITNINALPRGIEVHINSKPIEMDVAPIIENNRTLVPLRAIFEALGAEIQWEGNSQTITATKGSTVIVLQVGNTNAKVNGKTVTLDVPAKIVNSRTLVPARFVAESLGAKVDWDNDTRTVIIN